MFDSGELNPHKRKDQVTLCHIYSQITVRPYSNYYLRNGGLPSGADVRPVPSTRTRSVISLVETFQAELKLTLETIRGYNVLAVLQWPLAAPGSGLF